MTTPFINIKRILSELCGDPRPSQPFIYAPFNTLSPMRGKQEQKSPDQSSYWQFVNSSRNLLQECGFQMEPELATHEPLQYKHWPRKYGRVLACRCPQGRQYNCISAEWNHSRHEIHPRLTFLGWFHWEHVPQSTPESGHPRGWFEIRMCRLEKESSTHDVLKHSNAN